MTDPGVQVVFLHGRKTDSSDLRWLHGLNASLEGADLPKLSHDEVVTPSYLSLLEAPAEAEANDLLPAYEPRQGNERRAVEREFKARRSALIRELKVERTGPAVRGLSRVPAPDGLTVTALRVFTKDVRDFRFDPHRREQILKHVAGQLRPEGRLILIAHSLGSVIAIDLLRRLPERMHVDLLMTIGSPLSLAPMRKYLSGEASDWIVERAACWLNVYDPWDVVTAGQGIEEWMPQAVDVPVNNSGDRHSAQAYLSHAFVGRVVGSRVHGKRKQRDSVSSDELPSVLGPMLLLQYARNTQAAIAVSPRRARFDQARHLVRDRIHDDLGALGIEADLQGDLSAHLKRRYTRHEGLVALIELASSSPVAPYDVEVESGERKVALERMCRDLGVPSAWGSEVMKTLEAAERAHKDFPWAKLAFGVAGVAVAVAAPAAVLAMGAAGGAVGGAVITTGLVALGPGGMVGGLWMVGLASTGGGLALRQALTSMSPADLAAEVIRLQTLAVLVRKLSVGRRRVRSPELQTLRVMRDLATEELRKHERVNERRSASTEAWRKKVGTVERAIAWVEAALKKLEPKSS